MDAALRSSDLKTRANAIKEIIQRDKNSPLKERMREGVKYYNFEHEILNLRLFYFDSKGKLREETNRSNVKIPHAFFTELVDQKIQYLLSEPVKFEVEDDVFQEYLNDRTGEGFQLMLQEVAEGASMKAREYVHVYRDEEGELAFQVVDALTLIPIYDANSSMTSFIRYYKNEIFKDGKSQTVTKAELWTEEEVEYFVTDARGEFEHDSREPINPRPHTLLKENVTGEYIGKGWGFTPFFELMNNSVGRTDLEAIKALIDDYDIMASSLSNNLEDFQEALYVVKGYPGDNLDKLTQNIKTRRAVGVAADGDVEVREINIPYQARKAKLDLDKEGIYKFGMGFDSTAIGDGNITNVVIRSRYSLLNMKANKLEVRLRKLIKDLLKLIVQDINESNGTSYDVNDIEIVITRNALVNDREEAANELDAENTKQTAIENILSVAPRIGDDEALRLICEVLDLSFEELREVVSFRDYLPFGVGSGTGE